MPLTYLRNRTGFHRCPYLILCRDSTLKKITGMEEQFETDSNGVTCKENVTKVYCILTITVSTVVMLQVSSP